MIALIDVVRTRMGGDSFSGILMGMMPLVRSKVNEVEEVQLQQIANIMAQAFDKVSDPKVSESDFAEWLKFDGEAT